MRTNVFLTSFHFASIGLESLQLITLHQFGVANGLSVISQYIELVVHMMSNNSGSCPSGNDICHLHGIGGNNPMVPTSPLLHLSQQSIPSKSGFLPHSHDTE